MPRRDLRKRRPLAGAINTDRGLTTTDYDGVSHG
jgi:hypothetical protein